MHDFTQKFQFLIGNLITLAQILTAEHDIEFQFLIGNLITIIFNAIIKCIY